MNVTIIGLGLIGGSIAKDLRKAGFASRITGVDQDAVNSQEALSIGLVDDLADIDRGVENANLVIVAIPVDAARMIIPTILDAIDERTVVVDMGSTKQGLSIAVSGHHNRSSLVLSHPIAGTEDTGPRAAVEGLFARKVAIICQKEMSSEFAIGVVGALYKVLDMRIIYMDPKEHDLHIAYVSHLSHISSFTLGKTVLEIEKNEKKIFDLAGSGFASTVRLAKSASSMWVPILEQNSEHLSDALGTYINNLKEFKTLIDSKDKAGLTNLVDQANDVRRILDGIELADNQEDRNN
jgi:prephenate dehydrogenase